MNISPIIQMASKHMKRCSASLDIKWKKVKSLSRVQLFATPWTVAHQSPPSTGFSRQEYCKLKAQRAITAHHQDSYKQKNMDNRDCSSSPVARGLCSQWGGVGSIPGQGTRHHMPQLCTRPTRALCCQISEEYFKTNSKFGKEAENGNPHVLLVGTVQPL